MNNLKFNWILAGCFILIFFLVDLAVITPEDLIPIIGWLDEIVLLIGGITTFMKGIEKHELKEVFE